MKKFSIIICLIIGFICSNKIYSQNEEANNNSTTVTNTESIIYGVGFNNELYKWENNAWSHIPNSGSVTDIAVMSDGNILGIGKNKEVYIWKNNSWQNIPNSGYVLSIATKNDGSIIGVGNNKRLYQFKQNTLSNSWEIINGIEAGVNQIAIMNDGKIIGIGNNRELYLNEGSSWKHIKNSGFVVDITVRRDGTVLGVGTNNMMYRWEQNSLYSAWKVIPNSGGVKSIAAN